MLEGVRAEHAEEMRKEQHKYDVLDSKYNRELDHRRRVENDFRVNIVSLIVHVGTFVLVDRALDSKSKALGFDSHCWSYVKVLDKLLIQISGFNNHTASAYSAIMGTCLNEKATLY